MKIGWSLDGSMIYEDKTTKRLDGAIGDLKYCITMLEGSSLAKLKKKLRGLEKMKIAYVEGRLQELKNKKLK